LFVGKIEDQVPPWAKHAQPLAENVACLPCGEILEQMRRVDVVEGIVPKPEEIAGIATQIEGGSAGVGIGPGKINRYGRRTNGITAVSNVKAASRAIVSQSRTTE
jgi:hypothetical protein